MKALVSIFLYIITSALFACPTCIGSDPNSNDGKIVYILTGFILLTYIPFYFIYKTIIKNRNLHQEVPSEEGSSH